MSGAGLPPSYFEYPWRRKGLDHDRFPHRNLPKMAPVIWPGKARVALWVAVHMGHVPMDMPKLPFVATGGMDRPYPSYWDYTQRDYGNNDVTGPDALHGPGFLLFQSQAAFEPEEFFYNHPHLRLGAKRIQQPQVFLLRGEMDFANGRPKIGELQ